MFSPSSVVSSTAAANGINAVDVTYEFTPPNGVWSSSDTGVWQIDVVANQVADDTSFRVAAGAVTTFTVSSERVLSLQQY